MVKCWKNTIFTYLKQSKKTEAIADRNHAQGKHNDSSAANIKTRFSAEEVSNSTEMHKVMPKG